MTGPVGELGHLGRVDERRSEPHGGIHNGVALAAVESPFGCAGEVPEVMAVQRRFAEERSGEVSSGGLLAVEPAGLVEPVDVAEERLGLDLDDVGEHARVPLADVDTSAVGERGPVGWRAEVGPEVVLGALQRWQTRDVGAELPHGPFEVRHLRGSVEARPQLGTECRDRGVHVGCEP